MHPLVRKLLKPIFSLASSPGLGNPHTPYEAELMAAGVKPAAMMDNRQISAEMQRMIDAGHIVRIADHETESTQRIYYHPDVSGQAQEAARIFEIHMQNMIPFSQEEAEFLWAFIQRPLNASQQNSQDIKEAWESSSVRLSALLKGEKSPATMEILAGNITALTPIPVGGIRDTDLEAAVAEGHLGAVDIKEKILTSVFAQADKIEEGRELNARYFENDAGYEPLSDRDWSRRIGQLLGYTDNDWDWFGGNKYANPVINFLMVKTADIRREARRQLMLADAPDFRPGD